MGVGRPPTGAAGGIGADDMIVGEQMQETKFFSRLGVVSDNGWIVTDFSLRKNYSDSHNLLLLLALEPANFQEFACFSRALISRSNRTHIYG